MGALVLFENALAFTNNMRQRAALDPSLIRLALRGFFDQARSQDLSLGEKHMLPAALASRKAAWFICCRALRQWARSDQRVYAVRRRYV